MFTRVVEINVKPDKKEQVMSLVHGELLPLAKQQPGFIDIVGLVSETDTNRLLSITFWNSKADAERFYAAKSFQQIMERAKSLFQREPNISTYTVDTSTFHRIAQGKAA